MPSAGRRRAALLLALGLLAGACKGRREGVAVTEAPPVGMPAAPGRYAEGDTVYADAAFADSLRADSLAAVDSLRADSLAAAPAAAPAPDFRTFWTSFRAAARTGRRAAVAPLARVGAGGIATGDWPDAAAAFLDEPFRTPLLALDAAALRRDGEARVARVVVGYDAEGNVVPQDEADTDAAVLLRFEIVTGDDGPAWRLVRVDLAG